ncbi:MAG: EamA family transporter [Alphaproteobacteria bacterium]|nr:EamA family transporter [Alphaproteobacteria bacterium]
MTTALPSRRRATLIGFSAIAMWAALALLTTLAGPVPPFQLVAMAFAIPGTASIALWVARGEGLRHLRQRPSVWALGIYGLFGYHFAYFVALRAAPPVEAGLIAYLSPLLIVVFSSLLPGERLRWYHLAGALAGLAGTALVVTDGGRVAFKAEFALGYAAAFACALIWSSYSVLSRRFGEVPTTAVGGFCAVTAILAALCHVLLETTVWPAGGEWLAVLLLGIGPIGLAFFTWDVGMKHGDIQALGGLFYIAPLGSTALLILFGKGEASWIVGAATFLIVGGAALATLDVLRRQPGSQP